MKERPFIDRLDDAKVEAAIDAAERRTSGEIRVFVSRRKLGGDDVIARAARRFEKLGMTRTRERNGILFYFVPRERKYAVIGDRGIHEKCGTDFWEEVSQGIQGHLAAGEFTTAVVEGITQAGEALVKHFPRTEDDQDELSNKVSRDGRIVDRETIRTISLFALAAFFGLAGLNHFRDPTVYLGIMPAYLPWHRGLIYVSGVAEIAGGVGVLVPMVRRWAAWGLIALLITVFPANIQGALHGMIINGHSVSTWLLWGRLPVQIVFIAWVWWTCLSNPASPIQIRRKVPSKHVKD